MLLPDLAQRQTSLTYRLSAPVLHQSDFLTAITIKTPKGSFFILKAINGFCSEFFSLRKICEAKAEITTAFIFMPKTKAQIQ